MGRPFLSDLIAAHLVDGFHQVTHDVELVEDQHRLGSTCPDDVDVGLPRVAADAFERRASLRSEELEKPFKGLLGASLAAPDQTLVLQVVDVGHVDMTALSRDLIDPDVGQPLEVAMCKPKGHPLLDRDRHRPPGTAEQSFAGTSLHRVGMAQGCRIRETAADRGL